MVAGYRRLLDARASFGLNRPSDMAAKMWREYERCRHAKSADDLRDHCINFAITAWHVGEWVWVGITETDHGRVELGKVIGIKNKKVDKDDFIKWLIEKCPELIYCQGICNGSKHVLAGKETNTALDLGDKGAPERLVPNISDGTTTVNALSVYDKVVHFWIDQLTNTNVIC